MSEPSARMVNLGLFGLVCGFALAACSVQEEYVREDFVDVSRLEQVNRGELRWEVLIEKQRARALVSLVNSGSYPVQCDQVGFRTIFDYPVSYLEAGEVVSVGFNHFINTGERISFAPVVSNEPERQIRSVQGGVADQCRVATFIDACENAQQMVRYGDAFSVLFESFDSEGCLDLHAALRRERVVDLRDKPEIALDPFDLLSFEVTFLVLNRNVSSVRERVTRLRDFRHQVLAIAEACGDTDVSRLWHSRECFPDDLLE